MMVLPTDIELVEAAAATYTTVATPYYEDSVNAIRIFYSPGNPNILAVEGTFDAQGWAIDFCALGIKDHPVANHPTLGFVHAGFLAAALLALPHIESIAKDDPFAICGHSLGAAMALLIGGLLIDNGTPPVKIGAFAPPRVGSEQFVKVTTSVPFCAYAYGNDPVPRVPFRIIPLFPYMQVGMTDIGTPRLNEFSCHAIANYVAGVTEKQS